MTPNPKSNVASTSKTVNTLLLRAHALLQTPLSRPTLRLALYSADSALKIASHSGRFDLEPRAHLYRGHVLRAWGRWRAAHAAYVRAASVRIIGFSAAKISDLTRECHEMMEIERKLDSERHGEMMERRGSKMVQFADGSQHHEGHDGELPGESYIGMYLLLNEGGDVVGSCESMPELRSVRGRSVHRPLKAKWEVPGDGR